jgi:hypothetical protein
MMRRKAGALLVESLVALAVSMMIFSFLLTVFPAAYEALVKMENIRVATAVGQSVLEEARALPFDSLASAQGTRSITYRVQGQDRTMMMAYSLVVASVGAGLKDLTLTVTWGEKGGSRSVVLETLVFREE